MLDGTCFKYPKKAQDETHKEMKANFNKVTT